MKKIIIMSLSIILLLSCTGFTSGSVKEKSKTPLLFFSFFIYEEQAKDCLTLCESIRTFAGSLSKTPIIIYYHENLEKLKEKYLDKFSALDVELKRYEVPEEAFRYDLGPKPFIAAQSEIDFERKTDILVYLDPNIIIIKEPKDFLLKKDKSLGYRPVMHQNVGSLYSEKPDAFWSRIYKVLEISENTLFPMEAIADKNVLRSYFNAGLLIVRPEKGIMRNWAECFETAYKDPELADMCKTGPHNVFLHQAVLTGAILNNLEKQELELLPFAYNYLLFFEKFYDSKMTFNSIDNIISLKCELFKQQLPDGWDKKLKGSPKIIKWIKEQFSK